MQGIFYDFFRHHEEILNHFFIKILYAYRTRTIMKLSIIGVKQSMQLKTNKKKNLKPIHQLYSFNFQGEHQIIINSSSNTETQRHLQVFLLLFKKYSQAVDPASTESERNDLTAEIAAATLQHHSGAITEEEGERKRFLKRRCISSLDPKLSA